MEIANFWKDKRVFITGHTGFKGSWLSLWLSLLGAKVSGYSLKPPTNPNLFSIAKVADKLEYNFINNINDIEILKKSLELANPEIVFHLAAQPLVRYSYINPVETYTTNIIGTVNILESIRQMNSVKAVINVTTDKCYENKEWIWSYRENESMGGYDPYSSSKACSELVTSAYRQSFFSSKNIYLATARAGNVIGGGDWAQDRLIPDILQSVSNNQKVVIRNPEAIRPWQHVLEPLNGYMILAEKLFLLGEQFSESWNFGPSEEDAKPVSWIVENLLFKFSKSGLWQRDESKNPHEAHYLKLDCSKARTYLGWKPRWNLEKSLSKIVEWQEVYWRNGNISDICINQINEYMGD